MSAASWLAEFYPRSAKAFIEETPRTAIEATYHSLRKWRGLTPRSLKRHGVHSDSLDTYALYEDGTEHFVVRIQGVSCSLCWWTGKADYTGNCKKCPLYEQLGRPCDYEQDSPWAEWVVRRNAVPMIRALAATLRRLKKAELRAEMEEMHAVSVGRDVYCADCKEHILDTELHGRLKDGRFLCIKCWGHLKEGN